MLMKRIQNAVSRLYQDCLSRRAYRPRPKRLQIEHLESRCLLDGMALQGTWDQGGPLYSDGWGESHYAYLGHYQNNNGLHIIDIADPTNPTLVSTFRSASGWNDFRDVETAQVGLQTIAFASSDTGGGLLVIDVTDHANPRELYRITTADGGTNTVHTLSVDGDYVYEADSRTPNIRVFNISNPAAPTFLRTIHSASNGPVHEVTALNGRLYTAVIDSAGRSEVYDITNVGDTTAPVPLLVSIPSGSSAHTAWPTEDGNFVAVARETLGGDVRIWDIRDPANPVRASTISLPTNVTYSLHQVMISGNLLYISAYEAGVLVYDISDPYAPVQVATYETYHGPVNGYDGCWGVYPFLGPDRILAFDMRTGLYVLSLPMASISGQTFNDLNGNGHHDEGDPGLPGWTIFLDLNHTGVLDPGDPWTVSDENGNYSFTNLGPGTYDVREVAQDGWVQTTADPDPIVASVGIYVTNVTGVEFGNQMVGGRPRTTAWSGPAAQPRNIAEATSRTAAASVQDILVHRQGLVGLVVSDVGEHPLRRHRARVGGLVVFRTDLSEVFPTDLSE